MAAIAKLRDDISGKLTATGNGSSGTPYAFSSNQGFDTLTHMDGAMLSFKVGTTNVTPAVLNVDGLGAKALRVSPGVELGVSTLVVGVPYGVTYSNTDGAWYFQDGALTAATILAPILPPIGSSVVWWTDTLPSASWLWCNGTTVSQAAYPALALVFGVAVGGTITLPDLRETTPVGKGGMGGTGGRGLLSFSGFNVLKTLFGAQTVAADLAAHAHTGALNNSGLSATTTDHEHQVAQVIAGGGLGTQGLALGNFNGNTFTGASDRSLTVSGGVIDPNFTTTTVGAGGGHNNIQPTTICNWIIRAQ
jgi:microcystin-dependent protein